MRFVSIRFDRIRCIHARGRYHFARASSVRPPSYPVIPRAKTTHDTTAAKTVSAFRLPGVISRRRRLVGVDRRVSREKAIYTRVHYDKTFSTVPTVNSNISRNDQRLKFERGGTGARCPRVRRARAIHGERTRRRSREDVDAIRGRVVHRSIDRRVRRERAVESSRARTRTRSEGAREFNR